MENDTSNNQVPTTPAPTPTPPVTPTLDTKKPKNIKKLIIIVVAIVVVLGAAVAAYFFLIKDNSQTTEQSSEQSSEQTDVTPTASITPTQTTDDSQQVQTDNTNYMELPNLGIRIPMSEELANEFNVTEIDDGYRLDLKIITNYREQGYCGNGGSSAIGTIISNTVSLAPETESSFFDNAVFHFTNNVIYPKKYITFVNTDAACWDLGSGGTERGEEVAQKVAELKTSLEEALKNVTSIN